MIGIDSWGSSFPRCGLNHLAAGEKGGWPAGDCWRQSVGISAGKFHGLSPTRNAGRAGVMDPEGPFSNHLVFGMNGIRKGIQGSESLLTRITFDHFCVKHFYLQAGNQVRYLFYGAVPPSK